MMEFIAPLVALIAIGSFTMVGLKMWLTYRTQRSVSPGDPQAAERLADDVQQLRDEVESMRHLLTDMDERLDFAERVLVKGRGDDAVLRPPS